MSKFNFKLQKYLHIKEKLEEHKKYEYAISVEKMQELIEEKTQLANLKDQYIKDLRQNLQQKNKSSQFMCLSNYINAVHRKILTQQDLIDCARENVLEKSLALQKAAKERKMVDKLKERQWEEFVQEEKKAEQKLIDGMNSYNTNVGSIEEGLAYGEN